MDVEGDVLDAKIAAYWARRGKEKEDEPEESRTDNNAYEARLYRDTWNRKLTGERGSYEDATSIPPMRFTDHRSTFSSTRPALQIFSVKVEKIMGGLLWPIDIYGMVAIRDIVDHNRNIIFNRQRGNSQTLTEEDSYLALINPTRAIVVNAHPVYFEVDLKVKGTTMSEDKDLSLLAACYTSNGPSRSCVIRRVWTSKLSTLKFTFGHILYSVEATIKVEVINGRWPRGYQGVFTAKTSNINGMDVSLLAFEDGELPIDNGRMVKLSRRVVCVKLDRPEENLKKLKLIFCLKAQPTNEKNVVSVAMKDDVTVTIHHVPSSDHTVDMERPL
ncbi:hypothetical protein QYE76_071840 [Lolium multiflorum]|uniref:DUF6598 domain-containing protein n=1 Tax=Lolium multiflorum TaxID=4521 RepID=A0AAD8WFS4_LOLMU|nr:hypothetical protein QYE76_017407 [Lolium multiflorum]KAK1654035.1 hypothetical protein QYE76_071840 [Lolium multiflorum]